MSNSAGFKIETTSFEVVSPFWAAQLWPGRRSPIESNSAMCWLSGHDMSLMRAPAQFWIARSEQNPAQISGVLSGHFGGVIDRQRSYRTRGLWVATTVRRNGIARALMSAAIAQAEKENCSLIWTFPRKSSISFYESVGFKRVGDWVESGEFGPNIYALKTI